MDISSVNSKIMPALKSRTALIVAAAVVAGAVGSKMLWTDSAPALKVPVASATPKAPSVNAQTAPRTATAVAAVNGAKQGPRAPMAKLAASAAVTAQQMAAAQAAAQAQIAQAQADVQNQAQAADQQQQFQAQPQQQSRQQPVAAAQNDEDTAPITARSTRVAAPALSAVRHNPSEVDSSSDTEGLFVISTLKVAPAIDAATPNAAVTETKQPAAAAANNNVVLTDAANNALGERVITTATTASPAAPGSVTDGLGPVFVDDANSYYMRFPAAWSIRKFDGEPWVVECGDGKSALISVGFSAFPAEYTADDINLDWVSRRIKKRPDTTLNAQGYATIMNRKAVWSKSTGPMQMGANNVKVIRTTYILPLGDGRVAEIRIAAAPEQYEKISGVMKNAVSTFRLVPKRAPDTTVAKIELSQ